PPPPSALRPEVAGPVERVVLRALARRREDRHASGGALADELARVRAGLAPAPTPARRRLWPIAAVVLLGAVALLAFEGKPVVRVEPPAPAGRPLGDPRAELDRRWKKLEDARLGIAAVGSDEVRAIRALGDGTVRDASLDARLLEGYD